MPDIATISTALVSLKTAIEIARSLKNSGSSLEQAERKLQLAELIGSLADVKIEMAEVQSYLQDKDDLIKELNQKLGIKGALQWDMPYYWLVDGNMKEGPFCQQCYDNNQKLIRLQGTGTIGVWCCNTCNNTVTDDNYHEENW